MAECYPQDLLSEVAQSLGVSLTFLTDTEDWPEETCSLSALLSSPPTAPPPLFATTALIGLTAYRNWLDCGDRAEHTNKPSNPPQWSPSEESQRRRHRVRSLDEHESLWIALISRIIRTTIHDCSIILDGSYAFPSTVELKHNRNGVASMLAMLPYTQQSGSPWDACSLEDICHSLSVANQPSNNEHSGTVLIAAQENSNGFSVESPGEEIRPNIPFNLYPMASSGAQAHLLSSTLHPVPLVPVVCIADHANIIPVLCSTLHQRRVLGCQDFPAFGLLQDPEDSDVFRVLIGWLDGTSSELHIVTASERIAHSSRHGVFHLNNPASAEAFFSFLIHLCIHITRVSLGWLPEAHIPGLDGKCSHLWRECSLLDDYPSSDDSLEWIHKWRWEVYNQCNSIFDLPDREVTSEKQSKDRDKEAGCDETSEKSREKGDLSRMWRWLCWPSEVNFWLVEHDLKTDWEASPGSEFSISNDPPAWQSKRVFILPLPRECNGPIYDHYREKIGHHPLVRDMADTTTSCGVENDEELSTLATVVCEMTLLAQSSYSETIAWEDLWHHVAHWANDHRSSECSHTYYTEYITRVLVKCNRCLEYDHEVEASESPINSMCQVNRGPYSGICAIMSNYMDLVDDELVYRMDRVFCGEDILHNLHDFEPLRQFSTLVSEVSKEVSRTYNNYRYEKHMPNLVAKHHERRMKEYEDRLFQYPTGSVLDACLALAVPFPFTAFAPPIISASGFVKAISFFDSDKGVTVSPLEMLSRGELHLPLLIMNYQARTTELEVATINQQRMACSSAARFLAALGITDFPVYGLATFGSKGVVSQAWYEASDNCCYIVDEDRPEFHFDISTECDVRRYVEFLTKMEKNAENLGKMFEAIKTSLLERMQSEEGRASLCWSLLSQLASRRRETDEVKV